MDVGSPHPGNHSLPSRPPMSQVVYYFLFRPQPTLIPLPIRAQTTVLAVAIGGRTCQWEGKGENSPNMPASLFPSLSPSYRHYGSLQEIHRARTRTPSILTAICCFWRCFEFQRTKIYQPCRANHLGDKSNQLAMGCFRTQLAAKLTQRKKDGRASIKYNTARPTKTKKKEEKKPNSAIILSPTS